MKKYAIVSVVIVLVITTLLYARKVNGQETEESKTTAVVSISEADKMEGGIRYYSSYAQITVTGSGENFDLERLLETQPISGVYLVKSGEKAVGWLTEEGSYGLDFMPFQDSLGKSVMIENPDGIGNIVIDRSRPVITVNYPKEGAQIYENDKFSYFSKSSDGMAQKIQMEVVDKNIRQADIKVKSNGKNTEVVWHKTNRGFAGEYILSEGTYKTFSVTCTDKAGNTSANQNQSSMIIVDYTKPSGKIVIDGVKNLDKKQYLSGKGEGRAEEVTDNLSGVLSVKFSKSSEETTLPEQITDWAEDTIELGENENMTVFMKITDKAGNVFFANTAMLQYDSVKPVVWLLEKNKSKSGFYKSDVRFLVSAKDPEVSGVSSGVKKIWYEVLLFQDKLEMITASGKLQNGEELVIDSAVNNGNEVTVSVYAEDFCGNIQQYDKRVTIDTNTPKIQISYDNTSGKKNRYFNRERTATIAVREKNLDDIIVKGISKPSFQKKQNDIYEAKVVFSKDGCYKWRISCADRAGNVARSAEQHFVIDTKNPKIAIEYKEGNKRYAKTIRNAVISIEDINISKALLPKEIKVSRNKVMGLNWKRSGNKYKALFRLTEEGRYRPQIQCEDFAGNKAVFKERKGFEIDLTKPHIQILGVRHKQATNQKEVKPVIVVKDKNLKADKVRCELSGTSQGNVFSKIGVSQLELENLKQDDIYTLKVQAKDMAGNAAGKKIKFSVNRHGSSYELPEATRKLQGCFLKSPQTVDLTEVNVSPVTESETAILVYRNNEEIKLSAGEFIRTKVKNRKGWNEYSYRIPKEYFEKEGSYHIGICSKDTVNPKKNSMLQEKAVQLRFVIDRTAPVCRFLNIKSGEQFFQKEKKIRIRAEDNNQIKSAEVTVNGIKKECNLLEGEAFITLQEMPVKQNVTIRLTDEAGNESISSLDDIFVLSEHFIRQKPYAIYIIMTGILLFVAVACAVMIYRRKTA